VSNHPKDCRCDRCCAEITWFIRWSFRSRGEWLGMYQARAAAELGWTNHIVYSQLFRRLIERGELIEIAAPSPNDFPVYMYFKLCGSRFKPCPVTYFLVPEKGDALQCLPSAN